LTDLADIIVKTTALLLADCVHIPIQQYVY